MRKKSVVEKFRETYFKHYGKSVVTENTSHELKKIPEVGKTYHFWDDGKTSLSRHYFAKVERVVPMKHVRKKMRCLYFAWVTESINCYWVYATKSDYAVCCSIKEYDKSPVWFFRTKGGGWFSIDYPRTWMSGRLDVENKTYESTIEDFDGQEEYSEYVNTLKKLEEQRIQLNKEKDSKNGEEKSEV